MTKTIGTPTTNPTVGEMCLIPIGETHALAEYIGILETEIENKTFSRHIFRTGKDKYLYSYKYLDNIYQQ